jgi:hypothetical protein
VPVTAKTEAVNPALVALGGTVTLAGTFTAALLLARLTLVPPLGAAAVKLTVQASVPAALIEATLQEMALSVGAATPAALMLTTMLPREELLAIVRTPVNVLA